MERIIFGKFAGLKINGKIDMPEPKDFDTSHLSRASWLTAQVESGGKFGTVMNYDGTGMTAGIHQAIAVYPRALDDNNKENDQGPLWKLLCLLKVKWFSFSEAPVGIYWSDFETYLLSNGIAIGNNSAYDLDGETLLSGEELRKSLMRSSDGILPVSGFERTHAEKIIQAFNTLFSSTWTFETQEQYGIDNFRVESKKKLRFSSRLELQNSTVLGCVYKDSYNSLSVPLDLAMCAYWSNSVNAPGYALKVLCRVVESTYRPGFQNGDIFPRKLIQALGTAQYGRWDDDIPGGRYQRTRDAAMKKWPKELFVGPNAIMPKDLVG